MKLDLKVYLAQPKKGQWIGSIPWIPQLADPVSGPSPAQLKEELMFRTLELMHDEMEPAEIDRLLQPTDIYLTSVYLDVERHLDKDRPPTRATATTHVLVGTMGEMPRFWVPRVPGVCLAANRIDDMYAVLNSWAKEWADANMLADLEPLQTSYLASVESLEIDLGFPSHEVPQGATSKPGGRLRRPQTLYEVSTNLSHRAEDDNLPRSFGREKLVEELADVLTSARPASICLVGPAGVGKTSLVHEAAARVWKLSKAYQERRDIWQTSGDRIIAGMSIVGQWEQRTEALCRELSERGDVLFVENLLALVRAGRTYGGDSNVARFIEPYLEQDQFAIITEATEETWSIARSVAPGFIDKFRRIQVPELDYRDTLGVITDLIREIEAYQNIRFTADGVESVLQLTRRFFRNEAYPGKAVRLVKQCQHDAQRQINEGDYDTEVLIDPDAVARVVHRQTGLPHSILRPGHGRSAQQIRADFEARVFGQPAAIDAVTGLVVAIEQGLTDPGKPLGSFLLVGPSGVGKTETAKALATDLFGSEDRMIRFDMSEFAQPGSISRLIGTPLRPDGELTNKVRLQPFCVLLFDEVEKAHHIVLDLLLQLLGDGRLTDAAGRTVDFRNVIVIMTSNLGAANEDRWLGFSQASEHDRFLHYTRAAESFFRPEIFNRIDRVVPYSPLRPEALRRIARRTLQNLLNRRGLRQAQVMVDVDENLVDSLAERALDTRYGARTLAHRIERQLITPLAHQLTSSDAGRGLTRVRIEPSDNGVALQLQTLEMAPPLPEDERPVFRDPEWLFDPMNVASHLNSLISRIDRLANDPRIETITEDYGSALDKINQASAGAGGSVTEAAEQLRQRETFLNRVHALQRRVLGLVDPGGTGEFILNPAPEERKSAVHHFAGIAREVEREYYWLRSQLESLSEGTAGATLVFTGLSGPYASFLAMWKRWLEALSEQLHLELSFAYRASDEWVGDQAPAPPVQEWTAFAATALAPGALEIFRLLSGYAWAPQPPSHGQHALLLAAVYDDGFSNSGMLLKLLRSEEWSPPEEPMIEYVLEDGQFEDVRLGRRLPVPDDKATNLQAFVTALIVDRLAVNMD